MTVVLGCRPVKGYLEYLDLYAYFARTGERRLSKEDFESADAEWKGLAARIHELSALERARLSELKSLLYRDRP
jgi:hypothetical protein